MRPPRPGHRDVGSAALAAPTANISLIGLFLQAHFVVKLVMLGLVAASIWVWAIIIDKTLLFTPPARKDRFEQVFWSGQSLEELYRSLAGRPNQAMAAIFVAAMREWKRTYEGGAKSLTGLNQRIEKVMDVTISREVEALESKLLVLATVSARPATSSASSARWWGIMTSFPGHRGVQEHQSGGCGAGHRGSPFRDRHGPHCGQPRDHLLQQVRPSGVARQAQRLEGFADEFSAILSRQIDERG